MMVLHKLLRMVELPMNLMVHCQFYKA